MILTSAEYSDAVFLYGGGRRGPDSVIRGKNWLLSTLHIQCSLTFFSCVSVCLNDPFYKKGATENSTSSCSYWCGCAQRITAAKAEVGFRLGKNSVKFCVIKEEARSKWPLLTADAMNVIQRTNRYIGKTLYEEVFTNTCMRSANEWLEATDSEYFSVWFYCLCICCLTLI